MSIAIHFEVATILTQVAARIDVAIATTVCSRSAASS
jgi:hypothetical protein